jgi:GST-like protein
MLEETGLPYEAHLVRFDTNDQMSPEFLSLNPNNKIPAILDPNGPGGQPFALFESGAILVYLADKSGRFMPERRGRQVRTLQWVMFQMGGIGPMFGQLGFFHKFAGKDYEDKRPRDRYVAESKRLLGVLDQRLAGRDWIMGATTRLPTSPSCRGCATWWAFTARATWLQRVLQAFKDRPAVQRGLAIPPRKAA